MTVVSTRMDPDLILNPGDGEHFWEVWEKPYFWGKPYLKHFYSFEINVGYIKTASFDGINGSVT